MLNQRRFLLVGLFFLVVCLWHFIFYGVFFPILFNSLYFFFLFSSMGNKGNSSLMRSRQHLTLNLNVYTQILLNLVFYTMNDLVKGHRAQVRIKIDKKMLLVLLHHQMHIILFEMRFSGQHFIKKMLVSLFHNLFSFYFLKKNSLLS